MNAKVKVGPLWRTNERLAVIAAIALETPFTTPFGTVAWFLAVLASCPSEQLENMRDRFGLWVEESPERNS